MVWIKRLYLYCLNFKLNSGVFTPSDHKSLWSFTATQKNLTSSLCSA